MQEQHEQEQREQPQEQQPVASRVENECLWERARAGTAGATQEANMCVICQDVLGDEDVTALVCAHVFHSECLRKFMQAN